MEKDIIAERLQAIDKNADILFVIAPHFNVQTPNAGVAYLCEAVKGAGYRPAVFDLNILSSMFSVLSDFYQNIGRQ